jgi:divinyl chlorophyllide a 8-vinyl-reductase
MRVLLAGATGYIGQAVLKELVVEGHEVIALIRPGSGEGLVSSPVLTVIEVDVLSDSAWQKPLGRVDVVISCVASRSGAPADAERVEFCLNRALLQYAEHTGVSLFILLSAICVQKPRLAFQREKLKFEALLSSSSVPGTIIRPTAFFRSLAGQIDRVRAGRPFLLFGSGHLTACKPISDRDLARFMVLKLADADEGTRIYPIGGPGPALTPQEQGRMLCEALGKPFTTTSIPPEMFDWLRWLIAPLAWFSSGMRDRVEFLKIANFYATESMLVWDESSQRYDAGSTPEFGTDTLAGFYAKVSSGELTLPDRGEQRLF